jgi:2-dehydro-3-deoxyphosphogluconate aldolase/(4S)-4-hydroxy-2-oxoglutarate aldolase
VKGTERLIDVDRAEARVGCPTLDRDVIEVCHRYGKVVIPGSYAPTEILTAREWGADLMKVFPAEGGSPGYLKAIGAPLRQV